MLSIPDLPSALPPAEGLPLVWAAAQWQEWWVELFAEGPRNSTEIP